MHLYLEFGIRLLLAGALGALIGLERKAHYKEAGLRTHFILAIGAALIMMVSKYGFADMYGISSVSFDPSRIAAQVVSGIGFIGAGMIILQRNTVRGLTTAAGMWATAGIGLAVGSGMYVVATVATILILIGFTILKSIERFFFGSVRSVVVAGTDRKGLVEDINIKLKQGGFAMERMSILFDEVDQGQIEIEILVRTTRRDVALETLPNMLAGVEGVHRVEIPELVR